MVKSSRTSRRVPLLAAISGTMLLLALALIGGGSYIYANRAGASLEQQLLAAKQLASTDMPRLRAELAQLAGYPSLTESEVRRIFMLEQHRPGPRGSELLARELQAASPNRVAVSPELPKALTATLKNYHREQYKHQRELRQLRNAYRERLNTGWVGWWMRRAGYPKTAV